MTGAVLAILAAATFALNNATARRGVLSGTVVQGIAVTVPMGIPMFLIGALVFGQLGKLADVTGLAVLYLSLAGVVHFVWGRYYNYRAQYLLGANLSSSVQQLDFAFSLGLAVLVLGDVLTPLKIIGIVLLMLGPAFVLGTRPKRPAATPQALAQRVLSRTREKIIRAQARRARRKIDNAAGKPAPRAPFEPKYVEGYFAVLMSSVGYGLSPVLTTLGLRQLGPDASLVGGLVAYVAASLVALVWVLSTGQKKHVLQTTPTALRWFCIAGLMVGVSQMLRFTALSIAPVTVVQPIQRTSKLFLFYFSWILNRDTEVFDRSLIVATVISIIGIAVLSLPTEVFLTLADWPDWLVQVAKWRLSLHE